MATTDLGACEWFVWDLRRSNLIDRGQLDQTDAVCQCYLETLCCLTGDSGLADAPRANQSEEPGGSEQALYFCKLPLPANEAG